MLPLAHARRPGGRRLVGTALAACALTLCQSLAWAQSPAPADQGLAPVPPMPAVPGVQPLPPASARGAEDPNAIRVLLSPELETTLASQMVGRIAKLEARLGAPVKAGQTLLSFDCAEAQARLKMSQAENAAARETLGVKQRLLRLEAAGDLEVAMARAEVQKTAAAIEVSRAQLAHCEVQAPFDGRVVKVHVKPHQGVNIGAPLVELVSDGPLKLRLNVPSRQLRQVRQGTPIEVDIMETGRSYVARVTAVNARVDAVAQTIELEASLVDAPPELLPGMSGVARLPAQP